MKYISVCSGIEAASVAWEPLGWVPVLLSEIEAFPRRVLEHRHKAEDARRYRSGLGPALWGDFTTIRPRHLRRLGIDTDIDLLVGGTPCFPAGTMIALDRGFARIEDVREGDMALTHEGRFRRVLRTGNKLSQTVTVHGQGHFGMETTAEHPFLARKRWSRSTRRDGNPIRLSGIAEPAWVPASELAGHHWACVAAWPQSDMRRPVAAGREKPVDLPDETLMLLVGAYLGDGWARHDDRRGYVFLGLNAAKLETLRPALEAFRAFNIQSMRSSMRVQFSSRPLARWLASEFGAGAADKRIPMWVLGLPLHLREALILGYQITDGGHTDTAGIRATTVSRQLALTMRALSVSCGYASSVGRQKRAPTHSIEGRTVNQRDTFTITFSPSERTSFEDGGFRWQLVRAVTPTGNQDRVYDLTVDEDHSYVADGICVHNCQSFSVAGLRGGLDDDRGNLALEFLRLARRLRARWLVWENVPGVLSSNGGRDFGAILGGVAELGYGFAYRVLDAQHFGVPQRRRRVFVVGHLGDWRRAAAVLFEPESLHGDHSPRGKAGKDTSGTLAGGARRKGGYSHDDVPLTAFGGGNCSGSIKVSAALTAHGRRQDFEVETFIAHTLRGEGFDASEDGTGRGIPLVPVAIQERAVSENPSAGPGGAGFRTDGIAYTLEARTVPQAVAFNCREDPVSGEKFGALGASSPQAQAISYPGCVRRLTPRECERLQGFPDNYSLVPLLDRRGRPTSKFAADGPRYKALGNSMAVPVMRWIGARIAAVDAIGNTWDRLWEGL